MSCPHARGGERGLKGNLALSKSTGKYSLAISGLGTASEGIPFFDQTGQYLRPHRPEGKKEFGENRSHPPVSKWESGLSAEEKYPFLLLSVISLPSSLPTVTTLTLTTTTLTPAPPPNQGAILLVCHGSSHLEQPQCDTGIVIQLGQTVLEAWTCGEKPNTEKVLPINTCSFQMSSYKWRGSKQPPLSQRTTPGPRVFKSQALRLLVT